MLLFGDFAGTLLPSSTNFHPGPVLTDIGLASSGRGKERPERISMKGDGIVRSTRRMSVVTTS